MKYFSRYGVELYLGDCRDVLAELCDCSVDTCVTSPPYWGLRDYGHGEQIGLEPDSEGYVSVLVEVFREVRRVLKPQGTLWLNLGDTYNSYNAGVGSKVSRQQSDNRPKLDSGPGLLDKRLKPKDLVGIPWRVALALQQDGWWLRQDIIWHKPNPMPESVRDRCTKSHEYIFLLSKSDRYYFDVDAIKEPAVYAGSPRGGSTKRYAQNNAGMDCKIYNTRNKRSVWSVPIQPYSGSHFATYPAELITPCILAGSAEKGVVLDPFLGSGTTAEVACRLGRRFVGCELNEEYLQIAVERFSQQLLFNEG